jgi:hypothetical protein
MQRNFSINGATIRSISVVLKPVFISSLSATESVIKSHVLCVTTLVAGLQVTSLLIGFVLSLVSVAI